jgi:hypothetical protein
VKTLGRVFKIEWSCVKREAIGRKAGREEVGLRPMPLGATPRTMASLFTRRAGRKEARAAL